MFFIDESDIPAATCTVHGDPIWLPCHVRYDADGNPIGCDKCEQD